MTSLPDSPSSRRSRSEHGSPGDKPRINNVPLNVLCEIFTHTAQISRSHTSNEDPMNASFREAMLLPLRLSQVCWLWREMALILPSVWTNINVLVDGTGSKDGDERLIESINTWIKRSKTLPLHISVTSNTYRLPNEKLDTASCILTRLLEERKRWREAYFSFIEGDPTRLPLLQLTNVPLLEKLTVRWRGTDTREPRGINLLIERPQRLRSLLLEGVPYLQTARLDALTELSLHGMAVMVSRDDYSEMLNNIPHLETLKYSAWWAL
ncbi:uncharacterized protein FOMMEDRAFT_162831 [Fomitiporia mediterranea MF3/22]|uniref:F-box domain-containing protein n=1 Tax=Fomitiporia mediterranea (strain MF3/22) TaxID=694068 RepID=R7SFT4_FOMME|nr:uncharacterized protein FOMMEDRAFT_162831 [Fomitiporia mediterranea MF3/22]EJC97578.1 hypothetical protein FOMMEDRAFT_162831 [Fomitiporia mediterranea MF3/22]